MKQKLIFTRPIVLLFGLVLLVFSCQQDDDVEKPPNAISIDKKKSSTRTISGKDIPHILDFIRSKSNHGMEFVLDDSNSPEGLYRSHEDNLSLTTTLTDQVKQITNGYGKSNYTFKLIEEQTKEGVYFLNLIVKEYKDSFYLYIVKYVPDSNWLKSNSIERNFNNYTGVVYFYSDIGLYLAKSEMVNGMSSYIERNSDPCNDGTGDNDNDNNSDDNNDNDNDSSGGSSGGGGGDPIDNPNNSGGGNTNGDSGGWGDPSGGNPGGGGSSSGWGDSSGGGPAGSGGGGCTTYWEDPDGETWDEYPDDGDNAGELVFVIDCSGGNNYGANQSNTTFNDYLRNPCPDDDCAGQTDCEFGWDDNCQCLDDDTDDDTDDDQNNGGVAVFIDEELLSECNKLDNLSTSPSFNQRMQELLGNNSGNTEIGYWGRNNSNGEMEFATGDRFESDEDAMEITPPAPSQGIDSYAHNHHYSTTTNADGTVTIRKPYSVPSPADFYTMFELYDNNLITDLDSFIMVMTSPGPNSNNPEDDSVYAITISDSEDFENFASLFLSSVDVAENLFYTQEIRPNFSTSLQEKNLARLLKNQNLGVTLYRGDKDDLSKWTRLKIKNNGQLKENQCN